MKESAVRRRILEVASRLFFEQGYNSTGVNQIINEAGVAKSSLFEHFSTKRELLKAYLFEAEELWFNGLFELIRTINDPRKKVLAIFDYRTGRQVSHNYGGCPFIKISAEVPKDDHEIFDIVVSQKNRFKVYLKELLEKVDLSAPPVLNPEMLAETLFLLMEGSSIFAAVYKNTDGIRSAKKIAENLI